MLYCFVRVYCSLFPQVKRIHQELEISVDDSLVLNTTLQHSGDLLAHVLYLGGIPEDSPSRVKRQLGVTNFTTSVTRPHFKGTLQDIRVRSVVWWWWWWCMMGDRQSVTVLVEE